MKHSLDKGTQVQQALRALEGEAAQRGAARVMNEARERRDFAQEQRASALYEELRLLDRKQLAELAGYDAPRQQLIAQIIEADANGLLATQPLGRGVFADQGKRDSCSYLDRCGRTHESPTPGPDHLDGQRDGVARRGKGERSDAA
jgi:hypothetical protein